MESSGEYEARLAIEMASVLMANRVGPFPDLAVLVGWLFDTEDGGEQAWRRPGPRGTDFSSDDDPELIRAAAPFSLKLMESLLAESPKHQGLLLAVASGFTQFSYAFVQQDAEHKVDQDFEASDVLRARARRLYLRARDYGLRGLEVRHPGMVEELHKSPRTAVARAGKKDVAFLYWTAAAWGAAISISKDDPALLGDQRTVEALVDRALELDESYDHGAIHTFLIAYEMVRRTASGDPAARAKKHFERALELSGGRTAAPLVSYAEAVALEKQDRAEFESLLNQALAIDPNAVPESRLVNLILQERARWLLSRADDLFFKPGVETEKGSK